MDVGSGPADTNPVKALYSLKSNSYNHRELCAAKNPIIDMVSEKRASYGFFSKIWNHLKIKHLGRLNQKLSTAESAEDCRKALDCFAKWNQSWQSKSFSGWRRRVASSLAETQKLKDKGPQIEIKPLDRLCGSLAKKIDPKGRTETLRDQIQEAARPNEIPTEQPLLRRKLEQVDDLAYKLDKPRAGVKTSQGRELLSHLYKALRSDKTKEIRKELDRFITLDKTVNSTDTSLGDEASKILRLKRKADPQRTRPTRKADPQRTRPTREAERRREMKERIRALCTNVQTKYALRSATLLLAKK